MNKIFYLTTPLYYVNAKPHIGHAYTNILCDTFARYRRFRGEKVFFLTGTDEHGTKIEKAAREQGKDPRQYVDEMVPQFKELWSLLDIRYDHFIRTTDEEHKTVVKNVLQQLEKAGDIYKAAYRGWYCTPCESFWTKLQLAGGLCPDCRREVQELSEENYFFKLSKYQSWLVSYIKENLEFIQPEIRRNEIISFLKEPLEDLSITRPRSRLSWGIDYPTSKEHVVYVWFDALVNYITAAGYSVDATRFENYWPADVHAVGKDIVRQHAVYWPIMLHALGLKPPKKVLAHGWWTMAGAKVSKSRGNAVDPAELVKKYGVDAFRYFLLHEVTIGNDGAFSEDLLAERYTTDLANNLGNLWFRIASMLEKYFGGKIPVIRQSHTGDDLLEKSFRLWDDVNQAMKNYDPRTATSKIWEVITRANQFIEEKKPWVLARREKDSDDQGLEKVLATLVECVAHVGGILSPFLPETSEKILKRLQLESELTLDQESFSKRWIKEKNKIERGEALFPKLDEEKAAS